MLTISQLAAYVGVSVRTVRHYHQLGLLAEPRRTRADRPLPRWGWAQVAEAYADAWKELLR